MKIIILLCSFLASVGMPDTMLINGTPVAAGAFKEVVSIRTNNSGCTASIIGPKVMISAAHCARTDSVSNFTVNGVAYETKNERSSIYPGQDHDLVLGLINKEVPGIEYASIWDGKPKLGDTLHFLGFGCTNPGGSGGNDGVLREGNATVTGFSNYDIISGSGAALCYGDSGGPAYYVTKRGGTKQQVSVNSKGNIQDTNYTVDLTSQASKDFLQNFAIKHGVDICGINKDCDTAPNEFIAENEAAKLTVRDKGFHEDGYVKRHVEMLMEFLKIESPPLPYKPVLE